MIILKTHVGFIRRAWSPTGRHCLQPFTRIRVRNIRKRQIVRCSLVFALLACCFGCCTEASRGRLDAVLANSEKYSATIWDSQAIPKDSILKILRILKEKESQFYYSRRDCRMPPNGPMLQLAPKLTVTVSSENKPVAFIQLFVFNNEHQAVQVVLNSVPPCYYIAKNQTLFDQLAAIGPSMESRLNIAQTNFPTTGF